jgi:hypothetical protein
MPLDQAEIAVGRHYRERDESYFFARKVLTIADGRVSYVESAGMRIKETSLKRFASWAGHQLRPDEAAYRYAMVASVRDQPFWFVYKQRFPMEFVYSLDGQAIYAEEPCSSEGDRAHQFDVRDLPDCYTDGLECYFRQPISLSFEKGQLSFVERSRRQRASHIIAIGRALADGFDIRAGQAAADLRHEAREVAVRAEREQARQAVDPLLLADDGLPF